MSPLRCTTWLSPSLPLELFAACVEHAAQCVGMPITLASETDRSGPTPESDPFARAEVDLGFVCAPAWSWMRRSPARAADLLGIAPVFTDPRAAGRPVYFSDVVVRADSAACAFEDLRGGVWAYNDPGSLSGCLCLDDKLRASGRGHGGFFGAEVESGSHLRSLEWVRTGAADAAAIDSNVLALARADGVRVLESWGPYPIQPVLVRRGLAPDLVAALRQAWLGLGSAPLADELRARFHLAGFAPVGEADYELGPGPSVGDA